MPLFEHTVAPQTPAAAPQAPAGHRRTSNPDRENPEIREPSVKPPRRKDSTFQHISKSPIGSLERKVLVTVCPFDVKAKVNSPRSDLNKNLTIWEKGKRFGMFYVYFLINFTV